jgi:phage gpG-like protein
MEARGRPETRARFAERSDRRRNRRPGNLGKLTTAWKSKVEPEQLRFVNAIDYALVHHEGGRVGRGAKLPARPFAGFSQEFSQKAMAIWTETVIGAW